MEKVIYSLKDVAAMTGRHYNTIYKHVRSDVLVAYRHSNGNYYVTIENFKKYIEGK